MSENLPAVGEQTITALAEAADKGLLAMKEVNQFGRMFQTAAVMQTLKGLLTPEVMAPIMELQNSPLGFRTDRPPQGNNPNGYPMQVVKEALIEATLQGVYPVGNEFNIIAGRCYITKEGFGHKLRDVPGLRYSITPGVPQNCEGGAVVRCAIEYTLNGGETKQRAIDFKIRVNAGMGADAVIGKATRKARAWLYAEVTGNEIADGDAEPDCETPVRVVDDAVPPPPVSPLAGAGRKTAKKAAPKPETAETVETAGGSEREETIQWLKDAHQLAGGVANDILTRALAENGVQKVSDLSLDALRGVKEEINKQLNGGEE